MANARLALGLGLLAVVAGLVGASFLLDRSSPETIEVVVPLGAGEQLAAGEPLDLLPARLEVEVGDTLIIDNRDTADHQVGPYVVGAGERLEQTFTSEGRLEGVCTIHPSGEIAIVIS
jgi:plastocyanin